MHRDKLNSQSESAGPLGLMGREPACQTSEPGSNPSWDAMVHPVAKHLMECVSYNVCIKEPLH